MFKPLGRKRRNRLKLKSNKTSLVNNGTAKAFREYWKGERDNVDEFEFHRSSVFFFGFWVFFFRINVSVDRPRLNKTFIGFVIE